MTINPKDAIVTLGNGRQSVDAGLFLAGILDTYWDAANTNSKKPTIYLAESAKNISFRDDAIVVYSISEIESPLFIGYNFSNIVSTISLDFFTSGDRHHLVRMLEEARRTMMFFRTDTYGNCEETGLGGRNWLEWGIRMQPFEKTLKGMYRRVVDCRVNWHVRPIET